MLEAVRAIVATDRWNSFDRFHETTETLRRRYEQAGARAEIESIQTGVGIGTGRWVIHDAADVRGATVDIIDPLRRRLLDYRKNPWHVAHWSHATPPEGLTCVLTNIDDPNELDRLPIGSLAGKVLLTRLDPRSLVRQLARVGVAAVITDLPVPKLPDAVAWTKLGWGGIPIENAAARLVTLGISRNQGKQLRSLQRKHGAIRLHIRVDIRRYVGTHDVTSGIVLGRNNTQNEVWAIAHNYEPGAIDNASGVALCLEIAQVLESLIASGHIPRPRRSIRLLHGYECYGFFGYLEKIKRGGFPLAGVNIDAVGARPNVCRGHLEWHATIPMSATFVDRVGNAVVRAALRLDNPGYHYSYQPFVSTADTLIGDPQYGFPCPWLTTLPVGKGANHNRYHAIHSSADTVKLLSSRGLRTCAAAVATYLYYLADANTDEVLELIDAETACFEQWIRKSSDARKRFLHDQYRTSTTRLGLWLSGRDRDKTMTHLARCDCRIAEAVGSAQSRRRWRQDDMRIPQRKVLVTPTLENTPTCIAERIRRSGLKPWALYWADGSRTLGDITQAIACEQGTRCSIRQVRDFFEAHEALGYVKFVRPG